MSGLRHISGGTMTSSERRSLARGWFLAALWMMAVTATAEAQTTALFVDSQPGDTVGTGMQRTYTPADGTFEVGQNGANRVSVSVTGPDFSFWWRLTFS